MSQIASHLETAPMRERRKNFRVEWRSAAKIYDCDGRSAGKCIVSDFSNGGAKIIGPKCSAVPDEFILRITPRSRAQRCQVIWRSKDGLGVKFIEDAKGVSELADYRRKSSYNQAERHSRLV